MNNNVQGPWEVVIDGTFSAAWPHIVPVGTSLDEINEECIAELSSVYLERSTDGMPGSWVEKPECFDKSPDHDEIMRKARLIAAAPELLEALQSLFGADMETCMLMDGKEDQLQALAKAHIALAKATGESA